MQHPNVLNAAQTAMVIIDMQEAFRSKITDFGDIATRIAIMVRGAQLLDIPLIVTEQYPKGLGHTAQEIHDVLSASTEPIEKTAFSSCGAHEFVARLETANVKQVLVCGIEAHICVNQTTHDLVAAGYQVHLLMDCVSSRTESNKKVAFQKMRLSGALPSSTEMALFELLRDAKHEQFNAILELIR